LEIDWLYKTGILIFLLILSALFSGSEVALFSLNRMKTEKHFEKHSLRLSYLKSLLDAPRRLLVTILIGNTVVNVAASILAVQLALAFASWQGIEINIVLTIQIILLTIIVLIFGELIPKVYAAKNPLRFSGIIILPIYWISAFIFPISEIITESLKIISSKIKINKSSTVITEEELSGLGEIAQQKVKIEEEEQEIIASFVEFKTVVISEIMTPRVDIISVADNCSYNELIDVITKSGHSRIPVYGESLDEIKGFVYAKDLLPFINDENKRKDFSINNLLRISLFVPESKRINILLSEFQEKKMHVAIVVDEYGGTSGLVTLEDIIEEVVGEIWDEFDQQEQNVKEVAGNKLIVQGKTTIYELNEFIGEKLVEDNEDFDTVGGMIYSEAGKVPKEDFSLVIGDYRFTVKEVLKKRIKKVIVEKLNNPPPDK
jgi:magnesium and cobalt exporter, CNNM family